MAHAIQVSLANAVQSHETTSEQYKQLMARLKQSDSLLATLTAAELNITHLLLCDAAAVTRNGEVASTEGKLDYLALRLVEDLHAAEDQEQVLIHREADGREMREDDSFCSVLAARFSPSEAGWLLWFRKQDTGSGEQASWTDADIAIAQRLRIELLEICLAQATQAQEAHAQAARRLAHDLSTPLQTLDMSASMLKVQGERNIDLKQHMVDAVAKLRQKVEQVRQLGRGKLP